MRLGVPVSMGILFAMHRIDLKQAIGGGIDYHAVDRCSRADRHAGNSRTNQEKRSPKDLLHFVLLNVFRD
jgi:hypothetical protein